MINVLFVDDEPNLLEGLKRVLRKQRAQWNMVFVTSGAEALAQLDQHPFDVIVTDMRMPQMNGAQLLKEVLRRDPTMIRIVFSGQSEQELLMETLAITHQFFAKPCDVDVLIGTITRACSLRNLFKSDRLQHTISMLSSLPSLPDSYAKLNQLLRSDDVTAADVAQVIDHDPPMAAKVLQIANSALFGTRKSINSIEVAVNLLGVDLLKSFVLAAGIFSQFDQNFCAEFAVEQRFAHCVRVGEYAKIIADDMFLSFQIRESAFAAGLLHDVGALLILRELPQQVAAIEETRLREKCSCYEAESRVLQANHAEIGAFLLGLWGLPDPIVEAVAYHHTPLDCVEKSANLMSAVYFANIVDHLKTKGEDYFLDRNKLDTYLAQLKIEPKKLESWCEMCRCEYEVK